MDGLRLVALRRERHPGEMEGPRLRHRGPLLRVTVTPYTPYGVYGVTTLHKSRQAVLTPYLLRTTPFFAGNNTEMDRFCSSHATRESPCAIAP